jgi:uncharacterized protein
MIVVSNTSPLTNLAAIGQFDLLRQLYSELQIAVGVWNKLGAHGRHWPGYDEVTNADWIKQVTVRDQNLITVLLRDLDRGESETLALALEIGAELVLLDERDGRRVAQRLGLRTIGVLGVLLEAKKRDLLSSIRPQLDTLRQAAGFYVSDEVYRSVLDLAQE